MLTIGITGGTGSGKTTILNQIKEKFNEEDIGFISQDSYYNDNGDLSFEEKNKINFDHPDAVDFELMINHLIDLKNGVNIIDMLVKILVSFQLLLLVMGNG